MTYIMSGLTDAIKGVDDARWGLTVHHGDYLGSVQMNRRNHVRRNDRTLKIKCVVTTIVIIKPYFNIIRRPWQSTN